MPGDNDREIVQDILGGDTMIDTKEEPSKDELESEEKKDDSKEIKEDILDEVEAGEQEKEEKEDKEKSETGEKPEDATEKPEDADKKEEKEEVIEIEEIAPELLELGKEIDPDAEFTDVPSVVKAIKAKMDKVTTDLDDVMEANQQIVTTLQDNPAVAEFLRSVINGINPVAAAHVYLLETKDPEELQEGQEDFEAEMKKIKKATKEKEDRQAEIEANTKASQKVTSSFEKANNVQAQEMETIRSVINDDFSKLLEGKVTENLLTVLLNGIRYVNLIKDNDKKIKEATDAAYLKGKNEKIRMIKKSQQESSDGLPDISQGGKSEGSKKQPDWLDNAVASQKGLR